MLFVLILLQTWNITKLKVFKIRLKKLLSCRHNCSFSNINAYPVSFQGVVCRWHFGDSEEEEVQREAVSTAAARELRELQEDLPRRDGPKNRLPVEDKPHRSLARLLRRGRANAGFCVLFFCFFPPEGKGLTGTQ